MQLDVDMSPPDNIITFRLVLTHLTDRQTDRQTDSDAYDHNIIHMSPPCISTGGLKNHICFENTPGRSPIIHYDVEYINL